MTLQPPPVQQPYVPVVVAGGGKRTTLRLVAQYADASNLAAENWGGAAATDADVRQKYEVLQAHCAALGRPYASVLRTYHFVPTLLASTLRSLSSIPTHSACWPSESSPPWSALEQFEAIAADLALAN